MSKKIQLVIDDVAVSVLEELKTQTGADSIAEVIRDAVGVYNSLSGMLVDGKTLALIDRANNEFQELTIPSLKGRSAVVIGRAARLNRQE